MTLILICVLAVIATTLQADPRLPAILSDHMVLQAGQEIPIWGWADPSESITVTVAGQEHLTTADHRGHWRVKLKPLRAGATLERRVTGKTTLDVGDILAGEVWLYSGADSAAEADGYPSRLRVFNVREKAASWQSTAALSATARDFAAELHRELGKPIGLIQAPGSGSYAEEWTTPEKLDSDADFAPILRRRNPGPNYPAGPPGGLYNSMIAPIVPFAIKGVVWHHGEANAARAFQYRKLFPALMESWRWEWRSEFRFLIVQAPASGKPMPVPGDSALAELREAQLMSLSAPNTALIVTADTTDTAVIARRLALAARTKASGPTYRSMKKLRGRIKLRLENIGGGLVAQGGGPLIGFTIAGSDGQFYAADATIGGKDVTVSSLRAPDPMAVRYGWADNPEGNLANREGLPASPFRTDDWPGITVNAR